MPGNDGTRQSEHPTRERGAPLHPGRTASDELERWLESDGEKTLGSIIELFEEKSFALLFILLLGVSALPPISSTASSIATISKRCVAPPVGTAPMAAPNSTVGWALSRCTRG